VAQLIEKIEELVQPIMDDLNCELVDVEYQREQRGWVLRFFLDKKGGINLDECAEASREISSLLDVEEIIGTAYNLEVSSPGIERPLKKLVDFERFTGELAKIKTLDAVDPDESGRKRKTFVGTLAGIDGENVLIALKQDKSAVPIALPLIEKANLKFEF